MPCFALHMIDFVYNWFEYLVKSWKVDDRIQTADWGVHSINCTTIPIAIMHKNQTFWLQSDTLYNAK